MDNVQITTKKDALGYTATATYYRQFLCACSSKSKARAERETRAAAQQEIRRHAIATASV